MLLKQSTLAALTDGTVNTVFRRWPRPRVQPGSKFRTSLGVISVTGIEQANLKAITERAARRSGYPSRSALLKELARHPGGRLYRITLRLDGPDPRTELRRRTRLSASEREQLKNTLARLGARTAEGPWALPVLGLIRARPSVRAAELAREIGMETPRFKARVRQLKDLGLTESLEVGYKLSPRGRALLRQLRSCISRRETMDTRTTN